MSYEEFQHLARLFIVGSLDEEEMSQFTAGRLAFGEEAEEFIGQCRKLNSVFALSLRPMAPDPDTKEKLLALIKKDPRRNRRPAVPRKAVPEMSSLALNGAMGRR